MSDAPFAGRGGWNERMFVEKHFCTRKWRSAKGVRRSAGEAGGGGQATSTQPAIFIEDGSSWRK